MRSFGFTLILFGFCFSSAGVSAQHRIENRLVGLSATVPGDWVDVTTTVFGALDAPVHMVFNRETGSLLSLHSEHCFQPEKWGTQEHASRALVASYVVVPANQEITTPFSGATVYAVTSSNLGSSGYLVYFANDGLCYEVHILGSQVTRDEPSYFTEIIASISLSPSKD